MTSATNYYVLKYRIK